MCSFLTIWFFFLDHFRLVLIPVLFTPYHLQRYNIISIAFFIESLGFISKFRLLYFLDIVSMDFPMKLPMKRKRPIFLYNEKSIFSEKSIQFRLKAKTKIIYFERQKNEEKKEQPDETKRKKVDFHALFSQEAKVTLKSSLLYEVIQFIYGEFVLLSRLGSVIGRCICNCNIFTSFTWHPQQYNNAIIRLYLSEWFICPRITKQLWILSSWRNRKYTHMHTTPHRNLKKKIVADDNNQGLDG